MLFEFLVEALLDTATHLAGELTPPPHLNRENILHIKVETPKIKYRLKDI